MPRSGSTLSNKYAEGYPGRRYYGGCEVVDRAEEIGIARAKELFGAEHANLQPHSGASANLAAYAAFLQPGDTILGDGAAARRAPDPRHEGHLLRASGSTPSRYGVRRDTEHIDYDQVRDLAREHRPKMIICGGSAHPAADRLRGVPRDRRRGRAPILMVDAAHFIGLVAGKAHPVARCPYADVVTFTTHKVLRGPRGGMIVCTGRARQGDRQGGVPVHAGRPADARDRGQGGRTSQECRAPAYQAYAQQVIANAQALTDGLAEPRACGRSPAAPTPTWRCSTCRASASPARGRRGPLRRGRHRAEQERHPLRPAAAVGRLGHPGGHARR
ncbi:MAG: hypothetical protein WKF47_13860 [Geodermatophilaceae bacterium]